MAFLRRFALSILGALTAAACSDPAPTGGTIVLDVSGVPDGGTAQIVVSGPGYEKPFTATTTLEGLAPGEYIVRVDTITHEGSRYGVVVPSDTFELAVGQTRAIDAEYALASGSVVLTINGLPAGANADVRFVAPSFTRTATAAGVFAGLPPGKVYVVTDTFSTTQGDRLAAAKILDSVTVTVSPTPVPMTVSYTVVSATLALTVNGLPTSFADGQVPIGITGPNSYRVRTSASNMIRGLKPGTYTVTAVKASACPTVYKPDVTSQSVSIAAAQTRDATITYTGAPANPADLNLTIEKVELIQVTQDDVGSIPMVAGKDALLRVYGHADQCNMAEPTIRVTLGSGDTKDLGAPEGAAGVRLKTQTGVLSSTWNWTIPKELVQPGMTVVAQIDPDGQVAEANESDNRYPASNSLNVSIKVVPTTGIRLIPVVNDGRTGQVTAVNAGTFMDLARRVHPVMAYDVDVRAPYTTTGGALGAEGENWVKVLNEIDALRFTDNSDRYYYGVVNVPFDGGVAGIGFTRACVSPVSQGSLPGDCKAAIGWDKFPTAPEVLAHEVGHNFGRSHAPSGVCGQTPANPDPFYPYASGVIGVYGYDLETQTLKAPELFNDVMGYCRNLWISDHMYRGMLTHVSDPNREPTLPMVVSNDAAASTAGASTNTQPALLVWGRIVNGVPVLEPAFEIQTRPALPAAGPHRLAAYDEAGREVFALSFAAPEIADLPGGAEGFAFAVPLTMLRGRTLGSLRLTARGRTVTSVASAVVSADPRAVMSRVSPGRLRLQWDAARFPVVMVRDRVTGDVLSFARGGDLTIAASRDDIELSFSNRVRSTTRSIRPSR